jgi:hypothetical protein
MLAWLRHPTARPHAPNRCRPGLDTLEDRATPTASSITGNFNGTAIPAGDSLWFSSVAKVQGLPAAGATLQVTNQTISYTVAGVPNVLTVPDSTITLSPSTPGASVTGAWSVVSPTHFSGNVFLSGLAVPLPNGLPGGIKNVTWAGDFSANTNGLTVNWQWATAVYKQFGTTDASVLGVKAGDDSHDLVYHNSDHAGTPENFKSYVTGGAMGGGGSNWTGSYSGTASVKPDIVSQQSPATLSGTVTDQFGAPQVGVQLTLTGNDSQGHPVTLYATTGMTGAYQFMDIPPGSNYTVTETPLAAPPGEMYESTTSTAGQDDVGPDGVANGVMIGSISLGSGDVGVNYNFVNVYSPNG